MPNGRAGKLTELASMTNAVGRPRIYDTPEEFDAKVQEYYHWCKAESEPLTWTGLALYLGFSSRQSIDEYKNYAGFSDSVKRAKMLVENAYEKNLHATGCTGSIFALKNFGWTDSQDESPAEAADRTISVIRATKAADAARAD